MSKLIDLTGQKFGRLTVLGYAYSNARGQTYWNCHCECGNDCVVSGNNLRCHKTQSCGCLRREMSSDREKIKNLVGQKFGKLTVTEFVERRNNNTYWKCRCDCGNERITSTSSLISGSTTSCGCARIKNLEGQKFGRLTVLKLADKTNDGKCLWECLCECGNICIVQSHLLISGGTKSCGCLARENVKSINKTHGMSKTPIYKVWGGIIDRCENPNCSRYADYGGRGIHICERWKKFENFYKDISKLEHFGEEGYTLDRIDNNKGYEPENVRWATAKQQARNTRRNVTVEYEGQEMTLTEASEKSGVQVGTLWERLQRGETGEYLFRLPTIKK